MSRYDNRVDHVACWYDAAAVNMRCVDEYYSVSLMDTDGNEIECVGGSRDLVCAWEMACEAADDYGVEAIEQRDESGRVTDRYTPRSAQAES